MRELVMLTAVLPFSSRMSSISRRSARTKNTVDIANTTNSMVLIPSASRRPMDASTNAANLASIRDSGTTGCNAHTKTPRRRSRIALAVGCATDVTARRQLRLGTETI